ncbi:SGNH/GDSL hydrolase family protein [Trujillonella endophytica]|uniref:Lysophospholipase L1 n=1 Tax=Trujillonella endophytica TaxID=673521 RepID=A0A1H8W5M7_9ACTN|nr:SGNH/GDSL hydrolase family protein [Trujillella endophytica]SEP22737.1 Lysophospholipase L1 [Trujillella endophytica]
MRTFPRTSILGALAGLLVASSLAGCGSDPKPVDYLALGDSAPFGFRANAPGGYGDADDFVGYPQMLADSRGIVVRNLSCPGETTASFLDEDAVNFGCTNIAGEGEGYRQRAPLHTDYDGTQLDAAVEALEDEPGIELVTLQLGGNDALLCLGTAECATADGIAAMAAQARENLDTVLSGLRDEAGYDGTIVVVNYYVVDYSDAAQTAVFGAVNTAIAEAAAAHDAELADAFEAFRAASEESDGNAVDAGLMLPADVHPTAVGQRLVARTIEATLPRAD